MSKKFQIRTSAPTTWNKLYNNANNGGISWCIDGRPMNPISNVLANCVGYACARFNEIYNLLTGFDGIKYPQFCCDAERFWTVAQQLGLKRGQTPQAGAIMVWEGIGDPAGHVCIVEYVNNSQQVYTSESGYDSPFFWNATRYKGADGNWGAGYGYRFLGFIYNPACSGKNKKKVVAYKVFDIKQKKWLKGVTSGKASGNKNRIGGVAVKVSTGKIAYCVHDLKGKWLEPVKGCDINDYKNGWAGDYKPIDAFAIYSTGITLLYRVKTEKHGWLPWVSSKRYNLHDPNSGYAGVIGDAIIDIEIKVK